MKKICDNINSILSGAFIFLFTSISIHSNDIPEISLDINLFSQMQVIGGLVHMERSFDKDGAEIFKTKKGMDVFFKNRYTALSITSKYGIAQITFGIKIENDIGDDLKAEYNSQNSVTKIEKLNLDIDTMQASLVFMDDVILSMGQVATTFYMRSKSAILGINHNNRKAHHGSSLGIKLHGLVGNRFFEYSFSIYHGMQSFTSNTQHKMYGPGIALQILLNPMLESTENKDYFLGKKSAVTFGFTVAYQQVPKSKTYYKYKDDLTKPATQFSNLFFDLFVKGDVIWDVLTLPFYIIYEHTEFSRDARTLVLHPKTKIASLENGVMIGRLNYGFGVYLIPAKIMPSFNHSINFYKRNKDIFAKNNLEHEFEISLGYFPYGENLNLKISYVFAGAIQKFTDKTAKLVKAHKKIIYDNRFIAQFQMKI